MSETNTNIDSIATETVAERIDAAVTDATVAHSTRARGMKIQVDDTAGLVAVLDELRAYTAENVNAAGGVASTFFTYDLTIDDRDGHFTIYVEDIRFLDQNGERVLSFFH